MIKFAFRSSFGRRTHWAKVVELKETGAFAKPILEFTLQEAERIDSTSMLQYDGEECRSLTPSNGTQSTIPSFLEYLGAWDGSPAITSMASVRLFALPCTTIKSRGWSKPTLAAPHTRIATLSQQTFVNTMLVAAVRLFEQLPKHPIITAATAIELLETSKPTAGRAIDTLVEFGILVETTGKKRDRAHIYKNDLDCLNLAFPFEEP